MRKTVLPKTLIEEISKLHNRGLSSMEIFDAIQEEAQEYVESDTQLARCISAIGGETIKTVASQATPKKVKSIPLPKSFDAQKHQHLISTLKEETVLKKIEEMFQPIVFDILKNYEGFTDIQNVNQVPGFANPPFDFFGYRKGTPYLIEFKGSLYHFNSPGDTQKRRLQELRSRFNDNELHMALLQVKLKEGIYRIFFDDEMNLFFNGPQMPLDPVEKWIKEQLMK